MNLTQPSLMKRDSSSTYKYSLRDISKITSNSKIRKQREKHLQQERVRMLDFTDNMSVGSHSIVRGIVDNDKLLTKNNKIKA